MCEPNPEPKTVQASEDSECEKEEIKVFKTDAKDVQNQLQEDVNEIKTTIGDSNQNDNSGSRQSISFDTLLQQSYNNMDEKFLEFLDDFNSSTRKLEEQKLDLKKRFFKCTMGVFSLIIIFPYVMVFAFASQVTDVAVITLSITSLAEVISAIIVLPKIIAEYLFNKEEETHKIEIIKEMQSYNKDKRRPFEK